MNKIIKKSTGLILAYHDVFDSIHPVCKKKQNKFSVSKNLLEEHLKIIREIKVPVLTVLQAVSESNLPPNFICITFDDANTSDYEIVIPLLLKYNFIASFYLPAFKLNETSFLNYKIAAEKGMEIGSHGLQHSLLTNISSIELRKEFEDSKAILEAKLNTKCKGFAFPYGRYNNVALKEFHTTDYIYGLSTNFGLNEFPTHKMVLNRCQMTSLFSASEFQSLIGFNKYKWLKWKLVSFFKRVVLYFIGNKLYVSLGAKFH